MFVSAQWVYVSSVDDITEDHLKASIEERAKVNPGDYDLAQIEKGICKICMDRSVKTLEMQVWQLGLQYATKLEEIGYSKVIQMQPKLAIGHILRRISHLQLRKRMKLTLKLRKEEFKKDYQLFMRETAKEARALDRHDAASNFDESDNSDSAIDIPNPNSGDFKSSEGRCRSRNRNKGKLNQKNVALRSHRDHHAMSIPVSKKRWRPDCLNKKCNQKHFLNECETTSAEEKQRLLAAYRESKRSKGTVGNLGSQDVEDDSSLSSATFCNGAVETTVMADQGSDANVLPPHILSQILTSNPDLTVIDLERTAHYDTVDKSAPSLPCSRKVTASVLLRLRHGTHLSLHGVEWLVSDKPVGHVLISRHVLRALGLDNPVLLAAATERFKGSVDVPDLLEKHKRVDAALGGSIHRLLQSRNLNFGSMFHSHGGTEDDKLDNSDIYIDLGEDSPEDLEVALATRLEQARANGMSAEGAKKLADIIQQHKQIFD